VLDRLGPDAAGFLDGIARLMAKSTKGT